MVRTLVIFIFAVVAAATIHASPVQARTAAAKLGCPSASYLLSSGTLVDPADPRAVIVLGGDQVSIRRRCPAVPLRVKKRKDGWLLAAVWPRCDGVRGKARLRARLDQSCAGLSGRLVARRARLREAFVARRATCADGVIEADDAGSCQVQGNRVVGLRFAGVPVPGGASVVSAYVQFQSATAGRDPASFEVAGEASDAALPFTAGAHDVSARPRTMATVAWSPGGWTGSSEAGPEQRTPDLAAIVQEIVDRPGWTAGSSLALLVTGSGSRVVTAYDGETTGAAVLHVSYDVGAAQAESTASSASTVATTSTTSTLTASTTVTASTGSTTITAAVPRASVTTTPAAVIALDVRVRASDDDAEETASGSVNRTSTALELGVKDGAARIVGIRFVGVDIPAHAAIVAASVQFAVGEAITRVTVLTIEGEQSDSASPFASAAHDLSLRSRTAAAVSWSPDPWRTVGAAGPGQRTPDLARVLQEIVDRPGWVPGGAVALLVSGTGLRVAKAYDRDPEAAPLLHVEYAPASPPTTLETSSTTTTSATVTTTSATATTTSATATVTTTSTTATVTTTSITATVTTTSVTVESTSTSTSSPPTSVTSSTLPVARSIEVRVAASADDAEEDGTGAVVVTGAALGLGTAPVAPVSFDQSVRPILTARCATPTCHGGAHPQQQLPLGEETAYEHLVGVPSLECPADKLVTPGSPDASYLVKKLEGAGPCFGGIRMPPGSPLPASDVATIRNWIAQGALDE